MTEEIEDFIDKVSDIQITLNDNIVILKDEGTTELNKEDILNLIFRKIHSLKAASYYLEFDEIAELLEKTEDIIAFMRAHKCCVNEFVIAWFNNFVTQFSVWEEELSDGIELSLYDAIFNTPPKVKCKFYTSPTIIEHYRIVILHKDEKVVSILEKIMMKKFKFVVTATSVQDAEKLILAHASSFLISDFKFEDGNIINLMQKLHNKLNRDRLILVSNFANKSSLNTIKDKLKLGHVYDSESTKLSNIKQICVDYVEPSTDNLIEIPINSSKMSLGDLSKSIKPLPKVLNELKTACFESECSIKDVTEIVEKDPVLVGLILKRINSPFTALTNEVTKVGLAVSLLGKKQLGAMALLQLKKELSQDTYLGVYDIQVDNMLDMMDIKTRFLKKWMRDIGLDNDRQDEILTISLLMPLSMLLMNKAIEYNNQEKKFKKLVTHTKNVYVLEEDILGFDRFSALCMLMEIWNLPSNLKRIVKTIRTPSIDHNKEIQTEALILYLTLKVFKHNGDFVLTADILKFVQNHNLNAVSFKNTFLKITDGRQKGNFFN